jgi:uncharacterized membrane protein YagU involved in acid resistance
MYNKMTKTLTAGVIATVAMTMVMFVAPLMGLPKMNAAEMLSMTMGFPIVVGWIMHFMIGIIFAFGYTFLFSKILFKISNKILNGAVYGIIVFVFAQIAMAMMGLIFAMPKMSGDMVLMMFGSIIGHAVFGITITTLTKENGTSRTIAFVKS